MPMPSAGGFKKVLILLGKMNGKYISPIRGRRRFGVICPAEKNFTKPAEGAGTNDSLQIFNRE
jgi:hypothetical protein